MITFVIGLMNILLFISIFINIKYLSMKTKFYNLVVVFIICLLFSSNSFSQKTVYVVSTAHLDTQWNWTIQSTINSSTIATLEKNFALFSQFPDYKFNFENTVVYSFAKEYYPSAYDSLKMYVAQGRWHLTGSSWDANDVNIPSPESFFRNVLLGQTYFKREFNKKSTDIFLPDCFGFSYTLPTIASNCGLIGFSTQKLSWGSSVTIPFDVGIWQGVDGSQIMAALKPGPYNSTITSDLSNSSSLLTAVNAEGASNGGHYVGYQYYGTGDQGGAPDSTSVSWLEKSIIGTGPLKIVAATSDSLYLVTPQSQWSSFPQYNGELLMATHGTGCYTSHTELKRWNRKNELLGAAAERSSTMSQWLGGLNYPTDLLFNTWSRVIWHQFHDEITGTAIPQAYAFSWNDEIACQNTFATILTNASGGVIKGLNTQTQGNSIVVYNQLAIDREDIAQATISANVVPPIYIRVYNKDSVEVPAQIISYGNGTINFIFVANVKSLSYEVYDVRTSTTASSFTTNLNVTSNIIENAVYKVTLNTNGDVSSIIDKRYSNKELLSAPIRLGMFTDQSSNWPSWEIQYSAISVNPQNYVDGTPTVTIEENGLLRASLKIVRTKGSSTFTEHIKLTNWGPQERIDFVSDVDWQTKNTLLKAIFPLTVSNPYATYDLGLGSIKRNNNTSTKYEVVAQQWADLTTTDSIYGISIFNDCKYGWDKPADNVLRLTLIHTPGVGTGYTYQANQDQYEQMFTYSLYGHSGRYIDANTVWEADKLNQPLIAFETPKHNGSLGKSFSFASVDTAQVALKELKKAEGSDDFVFRVYETKGLPANNVKVKFCSQILSASELNGIEEVIGSANYSGDSLTLSLTPFQPKTFSVKLAPPTTILTNPVSAPVDLYYGADAITYDTNRVTGDFDGNKISYPAELLPDTIIADGIAFKMGPKYTGANNIIRCHGNKIQLPGASNFKKLYILAASNYGDQTGTFYVNSTPTNIKVQYFSGFIGQAPGEYSSGYFKTDDIAWLGTHRHNGITNTNEAYSFVYLYKYCILLPEGATELTLPVNDKIAIFAVTLANNENDDITNANVIMDIPVQDSAFLSSCNINQTLNKSATASGQCATTETPAQGVDGNESTKWCHNTAGNKHLDVDMGDTITICRWRVVHAGIEALGYITKSYALQIPNGTNWITLDSISNNTLNITDRNITPVNARNVRLLVTNSGSDNAARIYEFQVFGAVKTSSPYGSIIHIPGTVESENYDLGGEGVAYHDTDPSNTGGQYRTNEGVDIENCTEGGYDVTNINTGEWMNYTVYVDSSAEYRMDARVASAIGGGQFHVEIDSVDKTGIINVTSTGGSQTWLNLSSDVFLTVGQHVVRVYVDQSTSSFNLNKLTFTYLDNQINGDGDGLNANYYNNINFDTLISTRIDTIVNFEWLNTPPAVGVYPNNFSVRWTGKVQPRYSDTYTFYTSTEEGIRLWVNNQLIVDNWNPHTYYVNSGTITLAAMQKYDIRLEYFENYLNSTCVLGWQSANQWAEVIPKSQLYSVPLGINEINKPDLKIYPNPVTQGHVIIDMAELSRNEQYDISIFSLLGNKLIEKNTKGGIKYDISTKGLSPGVYLISLKSKNINLNKKLIVQ